MSEKSRKLLEDLSLNLSYALDTAMDESFSTGYALCENERGEILANKFITEGNLTDLHIKCRSLLLKPKAAIIIATKNVFE